MAQPNTICAEVVIAKGRRSYSRGFGSSHPSTSPFWIRVRPFNTQPGRLLLPTPVSLDESRLQNGLNFQGVKLLKNGLELLFQLLLRPWLSFCFCKLPVVGNGAAVIIGSLTEQFSFLIWC